MLAKAVTLTADRVDLIERHDVYSTDTTIRRQRIRDYFAQCVNNGDEGIVVKDLHSTYQLGVDSRGTGWVKMKPEYGDMTLDMDMLVLGAYHPHHDGMARLDLARYATTPLAPQ